MENLKNKIIYENYMNEYKSEDLAIQKLIINSIIEKDYKILDLNELKYDNILDFEVVSLLNKDEFNFYMCKNNKNNLDLYKLNEEKELEMIRI